MKRRRRQQLLCLFAMLLALTACGGNRTYKWDGAKFTVKSVDYSTSEADSPDETASGKKVSAVIDFGEKGIYRGDIEKHLKNGKITLAGETSIGIAVPSEQQIYVEFNSVGELDALITGEVEVIFDMDSDYEIDEADLVITE